jgi:hypothetical protein
LEYRPIDFLSSLKRWFTLLKQFCHSSKTFKVKYSKMSFLV